MNHAHPVTAEPLTAVAIDGVLGDPDYLEALPAVCHVDHRGDGEAIVVMFQ